MYVHVLIGGPEEGSHACQGCILHNPCGGMEVRSTRVKYMLFLVARLRLLASYDKCCLSSSPRLTQITSVNDTVRRYGVRLRLIRHCIAGQNYRRVHTVV